MSAIQFCCEKLLNIGYFYLVEHIFLGSSFLYKNYFFENSEKLKGFNEFMTNIYY